MATYAAYRHVELDNVGYGKKRVLKPPGGGSSDIFGAPEETSPRRIKNHNQSQLGSALFGDGAPKNGTSTGGTTSPESPRGNKPGNDSYKRLFGPPDAPSTQNTKNHPRSNISLSGESLDDSSRSKSTAASNGFSVNGTSALNGNSNTNDITDGNPVTGTGYTPDPQNNVAPVQNGSVSNMNGSEKSHDTSPAGSTKGQQSRTRVPPGGYSSGLW